MPKDNFFQVSQSKVNVWRKCRYAYYLRYVERLRRRIKARPLQFGSLVHSMIEADANGLNPFKILKEQTQGQKLFASEREELEEIARDVKFIMTDYFDFWEEAPKKEQLIFKKIKGKSAEHERLLDLAPGIKVIVKLDAIATTGDGREFLTDHKTFKAMPSDDHRWRSLQSNLYKWAIDELKIKVDGMCWNYIRSKPPSVPQLLKDGGVSKKRLDTLPSALEAFFKQNKVKPDTRLIATAEANRKNYFIRTFNAFRQTTTKMMFSDFVETAKEMKNLHGMSKAKTIDRHCDWCEFEPICRAELTGSDVKFVKKKEYTTREQREEIELAQAD